MPSHVRLRIFPSRDAALGRDVGEAFAAQPEGLTDEQLRASVEADLRRWYRSLSIVSQDAFAGTDPGVAIWYVYRDGKVRRHDERLERLYGSLASARQTERTAHARIEAAVRTAAGAGFRRPEPRHSRNDEVDSAD